MYQLQRQYISFEERSSIDQKAIADFERAYDIAIESDKRTASFALVGKARVHLTQYDHVSTGRYLEKAASVDKATPEVVIELARFNAFTNGKWEEAIETIEEVLKSGKDVDTYGNNFALAFSYDMAERHQDALLHYTKILKSEPRAITVVINIARVFDNLGEGDRAILLNQEILRINKSRIFAANNLAVTLIDKNTLDASEQAVNILREVLNIAPGFPAGWNNLGNAYRILERFEDAIQAYQQAITLVPAYADAYGNMGLTYLNWGKPDEAMKYIQYGLVITSGSPFLVTVLGRVTLYTENLQQGMQMLSEIIDRNPAAAAGYATRAEIQLFLSNPESALQDFNKALAFNNPRSRSYLMRGIMHMIENSTTEALADFDKAATASKPYLYAFFFGWYLRQIKGDKEMSDKMLRGAFSKNDNGWPARIGSFFNDKIDEATLLKFADSKELLCDAHFYIGLRYRAQKRYRESSASFQRCIETGIKYFPEYWIASTFLKQEERGISKD